MTNHRIPGAPPAPLSAKSAFVVHLAATGTDTREAIQGRIEHITSGRSMRFASSAELIGFMQQTLMQHALSGRFQGQADHNPTERQQKEGSK